VDLQHSGEHTSLLLHLLLTSTGTLNEPWLLFFLVLFSFIPGDNKNFLFLASINLLLISQDRQQLFSRFKVGFLEGCGKRRVDLISHRKLRDGNPLRQDSARRVSGWPLTPSGLGGDSCLAEDYFCLAERVSFHLCIRQKPDSTNRVRITAVYSLVLAFIKDFIILSDKIFKVAMR
jgi:hypothetical protein